jgi:hypothetical protein
VRRSRPGRRRLLGQRPSDLDDRLPPLDVAIEDLAHDRRLELVDLKERVSVLSPPDVPVAIGRVTENRHRARPGAVQLSAAAALSDLRALILGDHPLELAQQLILGRAGPLRLLREHDLDPGARELLEQQHLVRIAAREPVRRMTQHHLEAPIERPIAKPLQRRAVQVRTREPVVLEDQLLRNDQPALLGQLTQRGGLTRDRLLLALALGGHPRVDRRNPRLPTHPRNHAAHHRSLR